MQKLIQCGANYQINEHRTPFKNRFACGLNTGNLFIGTAVHRIFNTCEWIDLQSKELSTEAVVFIQENYDKLIFAAANQVNPHSDFGVMAKNIERLNMPMIVVGLGAQSQRIEDIHIKPKEGTVEFIDQLAKSAKIIGLRGDFTKAVLAEMNIHNTQVLGCPTYYINGLEHIGRLNNKDIRLNKVVVQFTSLRKKCDRVLINKAYSNNYSIIGQTEFIEDSWKKDEIIPEHFKDKEMEQLSYYTELFNTDSNGVKSFFKTNFEQFYSIEKWIKYIKTCDFVLGSRLHGVMIALQNGVPALLVVHDSRTLEIAIVLRIPYIIGDTLDWDFDLEGFIKEIDFTLFYDNYQTMYNEFLRFLVNNDFDVNLLYKQEYELENNELCIMNKINKYKFDSIDKTNIIDCIDKKAKSVANNLEIIRNKNSTYTFNALNNDPQLMIRVLKNKRVKQVIIKVVVQSEHISMCEVFYNYRDVEKKVTRFTEDNKVSEPIMVGLNELYLSVDSIADIETLRVDISRIKGTYQVESLQIGVIK